MEADDGDSPGFMLSAEMSSRRRFLFAFSGPFDVVVTGLCDMDDGDVFERMNEKKFKTALPKASDDLDCSIQTCTCHHIT